MKIYDITQEIFTCVVFPGDPVPEREIILETAKGDVCNLSKFAVLEFNRPTLARPMTGPSRPKPPAKKQNEEAK